MDVERPAVVAGEIVHGGRIGDDDGVEVLLAQPIFRPGDPTFAFGVVENISGHDNRPCKEAQRGMLNFSFIIDTNTVHILREAEEGFGSPVRVVRGAAYRLRALRRWTRRLAHSPQTTGG